MVTVGLIKELFFISSVFKSSISVSLSIDDSPRPLNLQIKDGILNLHYNNNHIWRERIEGDNSFFGVESCDSISRIITCLNNKSDAWKQYIYLENIK